MLSGAGGDHLAGRRGRERLLERLALQEAWRRAAMARTPARRAPRGRGGDRLDDGRQVAPTSTIVIDLGEEVAIIGRIVSLPERRARP